MIVVVSGLPRSGTSLMMQALARAGIDALTDDVRKPDESNPRGYMEFQSVKSIATDSSWVAQAEGKAVKVIVQLLQHLPPPHEYRVILMTRDIDQILASQRRMLERDGKGLGANADVLRSVFAKQLDASSRWLQSQSNMQYVQISYPDLIFDPLPAFERVATFIGKPDTALKMSEAVDPSLYREQG